MLDINFIRQNSEEVKKGISAKKFDVNLVDDFLNLDIEWRELTKKINDLRAEQKKLGEARKVDEAKKIKEEIQILEDKLESVETQRKDILEQLPNLPMSDVPLGKDESENKVARKWGEPTKFDFKILDHVELGKRLGIIDVDNAAKVSGSRFGYFKGGAARLEFAIVQYVFDVLTDVKILKKIADSVKKGYNPKPFIPVVPPVMIKPEVFQRMARLKPEEEKYYFPKDDIYLIGSAEHTLGPLHMDEIISEEDLPIRYIGFSTSFRREAGSYGKDTRGVLRVHQFDKLEMETFTTPEDSLTEQNFIVAIQEYLVQSLDIPYQVVSICTGDMGGPDARQIDIECWMPGEGKYRETHTSDLMTDYQSRRLNTKIRRKDKNLEFAHMNDATAFAIGRILIAIIENYQQKDGSIVIPKILKKYLNFDKIKPFV